MVRSMYSGVSGLRSHQTRMDTIGNNIANVNTYGFKSGRTTFRDIYYQSMRSASEPTAGAGGINPSSVGYGAKVGSVDLMMGRSTFTMTDETMDLAIDGDGFFQVQDASGNTYYTRAGMIGFDATGNLVDMQGNFVLGVNGDPTGQAPGSDRIRVSLPPMVPTAASVTQKINGREFTIKASNQTVDGNVNFNFTTDSSIADNTVVASITSTGIIVKMNPQNSYASMADFQKAVNDAITTANGGTAHPAGNFQFSLTGDSPFPLTADEICSTNFGSVGGSVSFDGKEPYGFSPTDLVGSAFSGSGSMDSMDVTYAAGPPAMYTVSVVIGGETYTGTIDQYKTTTGKFNLYKDGDTSSQDYFEMNRPSFGTLQDNGPYTQVTDLGSTDAVPTTPSKALGLSSSAFALLGGTAGGPQGIADMSNIYVAPNGVITGLDGQGVEVFIGRIDLATFANASGLNQAGSSNYMESANSGEAVLKQPGSEGAGKLVSGSLELSNVDLSREFSDMITTQRGYQANSRIITVSDTMLEELINLKR